ncbi:hypothetical protein NEF87_000804 [Candidatus Lokiarchaeum ossiferum]|uniref:HTH tetR-type domain-containing protein n=1 Tax=Candidatus Lokiarchaeum ossiferum TaxID=2951803 RepID=A0ABY6HPX3_9ARCH|nr:hypothetical protein NEF87_000804 [Candidatus Lokiarchaeum sp. B-35]
MPRKPSPTRIENKKNEIISAAWGIFRKNGYKKTTIVEIGNEIGQSQANIYYYFKNGKEQIYVECLLNELSKLRLKYEEIFSKRSPIKEKLIELFSLRLNFFHENIITEQLSDLNLKRVLPELKEKLFKILKLEREMIQSVLEDAKQNGEINSPDTHQTTEMLIHISQGIRFEYKFKYLLTQQKPQLDNMLAELRQALHILFENGNFKMI